jgi:iron only hydrogenase large subunit-like protein
VNGQHAEGKIFVASVSPQTRASLAAVLSISEVEAGNMISHLLSGPSGLKSGGQQGNGFTWVIDTNVMREACLVAAADEVTNALSPEALKVSPKPGTDGAIDTIPKAPILTSACPGWICYAEKTHPYVLPHLSRLKSPQALTGTLIKSVLSERYGIHPSQIWHLAIMPCFDKKLEASRSELTSAAWLPSHDSSQEKIRDTDCVITAREPAASTSPPSPRHLFQPPTEYNSPIRSSMLFYSHLRARRIRLQSQDRRADTYTTYFKHTKHRTPDLRYQ